MLWSDRMGNLSALHIQDFNSRLVDFANRQCSDYFHPFKQALVKKFPEVLKTLLAEDNHLLFPCSEGDLEMETPLRKMLGDFGRPRPSSTTPALLSSPDSQFKSMMIWEATCRRAFNLDCESVWLPFAFLRRRRSSGWRRLVPETANLAAPRLLDSWWLVAFWPMPWVWKCVVGL